MKPSTVLLICLDYDWSHNLDKFCPTSLVISQFHVQRLEWRRCKEKLFLGKSRQCSDINLESLLQILSIFFPMISNLLLTGLRYFESDTSTHPLNITGLLTKTFVPSSAFVVFFVVFPSIWLVVRVHCVTVLPIVPTPGEEIQTTPKLSLKSDCA